MDQSNINDMKELVSQTSEKYSFRLLNQDDAQTALRLMVAGFAHHNPVIEIISGQEEDVESWLSPLSFSKIIEQKLSYGAFYEGKLVSASIAFDMEVDILIPAAPLTKKAQKIKECYNQLMNEYLNSREFEKGELVYLSLLGTDANHFRKKLASICIYLTACESQLRGFKIFLTDSWHIGTEGSVKKVFKNVKIIKQLKEFEGEKADLQTIVCNFSKA